MTTSDEVLKWALCQLSSEDEFVKATIRTSDIKIEYTYKCNDGGSRYGVKVIPNE